MLQESRCSSEEAKRLGACSASLWMECDYQGSNSSSSIGGIH